MIRRIHKRALILFIAAICALSIFSDLRELTFPFIRKGVLRLMNARSSLTCRDVLDQKNLERKEILILDAEFYNCLQQKSLESCLLRCSPGISVGVLLNNSQPMAPSIHVVPVVDKGHFWLLPEDPKRAFFKQPFTRHRLRASADSPVLLLPTNPRFLGWQMGRNRWVDCDRELSRRMAKLKLGKNKLGIKGVAKMAHIRDMFFSLTPTATPFFIGRGTLLGWYRHCGVIPFTTDFDTWVPIETFNEIGLANLTKGIPQRMKIEAIFGEPKKGLEMAIRSGKVKIDTFFIYSNQEEMWHFAFRNLKNGKFQLLKFPLPKMSVCVGELFGHLFHVPCEPSQVLETMYGPEWASPKKFSLITWWKGHIYKTVGEIANSDFIRPF